MENDRTRPDMSGVFEVFGQVSGAERLSGAPQTRACAWPGCAAEGSHKAPLSRTQIERYQWLCLEHVRAFNSSWNFYKDMSEAEVEANIRSDTTWNRPSWPFNGVGSAAVDAIADPFGLLGFHGRAAPQAPQLSNEERRAFRVLEIDAQGNGPNGGPVTFDVVKARYKELVKIHHPDANGGAKDAEERLKRINEAYHMLKNGLFAQA